MLKCGRCEDSASRPNNKSILKKIIIVAIYFIILYYFIENESMNESDETMDESVFNYNMHAKISI